MKNDTKVRLHLTKQLFESLTKQVIAEGKKNYGTGMEEVKGKKQGMKPTNEYYGSSYYGSAGVAGIPGHDPKEKIRQSKEYLDSLQGARDREKERKAQEKEKVDTDQPKKDAGTLKESSIESLVIASLATVLGVGVPILTPLIKNLLIKDPKAREEALQAFSDTLGQTRGDV